MQSHDCSFDGYLLTKGSGGQNLLKTTKQLKLSFSQMSTYWQQLKKIDENTKYLVSGYIRKEQKLIKQSPYTLFQNVPIFVSSLCTLYYHVTEYFNSIGKDILSSNNKTTLMPSRSPRHSIPGTSYGNMVIPSKSDCIYKWQIGFSKIMTQRYRFTIGIASTSITTTKQPFHRAESGEFYCFSPYFGTVSSHLTNGHFGNVAQAYKWAANVWRDKIDLELDLKRKKLLIYKYDEFEKSTKNVIFHNVEVRYNLDYRLAVILCDYHGNDLTVSIVKFHKTY